MKKQTKKSNSSSIHSWADWFEQAAQTFDDPRMKIAYYKNGQTGEPYSQESMMATYSDIFEKLNAEPHHKLLDIGCGVGFFENNYSNQFKSVVGTDVSFTMIQSAKKLNPLGNFFVSQCDFLGINDNQFDRILSYGVTQYLTDENTVIKMLNEILRVLKNQGVILIGDILIPIETTTNNSYQKPSPKGNNWWPKNLDHNLSKLYLPKKLFEVFCQKNNLTFKFYDQNISGRSVPTPRYEIVITKN